MILRPNTAARVPIALMDEDGAYVTGILPADITDGSSSGNLNVVKGDSTVDSVALTNGVNFFEVDATGAPGLYHVLLPTSVTDVQGTLQVVVLPAAAAFLATIITAQVDANLFDFA